MITMLDKGIRKSGAVVALAAAGVANAAAIYQIDNWANQVGTRTFRIVRISGLNAAGADTVLHIGTGVGAAFVDRIVPIPTLNGLAFEFNEDDLPEVVFDVDATAYPVAATVSVQVEVEVLF